MRVCCQCERGGRVAKIFQSKKLKVDLTIKKNPAPAPKNDYSLTKINDHVATNWKLCPHAMGKLFLKEFFPFPIRG